MSETQLELLVAQVEVALEEGDLEAARRLLETARAHFPGAPELHRLGQRLDEVQRLAARSTVDELVESARERMRAADYPAALERLGRAARIDPENAELRALLEQAEKAAERHAQAVDKQQKISAAAREIDRLLGLGDLQAARQGLRGARGQFGRQKVFQALEERLHELVGAAQVRGAEEHLERAREAAARRDWHGSLNQAELALSLSPGHADAKALRHRARFELEAVASVEHRRSALEEARVDVERLLTAGELARADRRLRDAVDALGREPLFDQLAEAIDKAKKDQEFRRRFEWRERRAKEAEALVAEATRRGLGGDFDAAVEKLEAARALDPTHPEIEEKLATHRAAADRHRRQDERAEAREEALETIRAHLDALRLEEAESALQATRSGVEDPRLERLAERLAGLREAEDPAGEGAHLLPTPKNLKTLGLAARSAIRSHERTVASAYSWRQAFGYPLRGHGPLLLALLAGAFALGHMLALALGLPDVLTPVLVAVLAPGLVQASLEGKNLPPPPSLLWRTRTGLRDALMVLAILVSAAAAPLLFALTGPRHGLFERGPQGFLVFSLRLFLSAGWLAAALGPVLAFGPGSLIAPRRLVRPGASLLAVSAFAFAVLVASLWIRIAVPAVMAVPLVAVLEAYGLLTLAHLAGVLVRSRRLDWASSYVAA